MKTKMMTTIVALGAIANLAVSAQADPSIHSQHFQLSSSQHAYAIEKADAKYPVSMRERGTSGQARIKLIVNEVGEVAEAKILSASRPEFGAAALDSIKSWLFEPAYHDGLSVASVVIIPVRFNIMEASSGTEMASLSFR